MISAREETEQALIGGLLISPKGLVDVAGILNVDDFVCVSAKKAYGAMLAVWKSGEKIDYISVLDGDKSLSSYLIDSTNNAAANVKRCAAAVSSYAKAGRVNDGVQGILSESNVTKKLDKLLSLYQQEMFVDRKAPGVKDVISRFSETVRENKKRGSMGVSTGFKFLDDIYVQYVPGQLWTIGAYTSVGKTAMMVQLICNLLWNDKNPHSVIVSTEMTEEQLTSRILSNFTGIPSQRILSGNIYQGEEEPLDKCKAFVAEKRLTIYDDIYTLGDIETVFRKAELQGGVDIGWIDYVQNCQVPDAASPYQEQSTLAKRLQKLAKDVRATTVCLSQVSNDVGRGNTNNLELKGAGEWAAVSDLGIMLYRDKANKYLIKYAIKKNRHGPLHDEAFLYTHNFSKLEPQGKIEDGE